MKKTQLKQLIREVAQEVLMNNPKGTSRQAALEAVKRTKANYDRLEMLRNEAWEKTIHCSDAAYKLAMDDFYKARHAADAAYNEWATAEENCLARL
jgi:hypothetical protein